MHMHIHTVAVTVVVLGKRQNKSNLNVYATSFFLESVLRQQHRRHYIHVPLTFFRRMSGNVRYDDGSMKLYIFYQNGMGKSISLAIDVHMLSVNSRVNS